MINAERTTKDSWQGVDSEIGRLVTRSNINCIQAYKSNRNLIEEHGRMEQSLADGGYSHKQIFELIQNASDALIKSDRTGRVRIVLTPSALYCADDGNGITPEGVSALLGAHLSVKGGDEIGQHGLGFKSVAELSDHPQFISQPGSFAFDGARSRKEISEAMGQGWNEVPTPSLRLAWPIDPHDLESDDPVLKDLMAWATTIVKAPIDDDKHHKEIANTLQEFPKEFVLFTPQVNLLELEDKTTKQSTRTISRVEHIDTNGEISIKDSQDRSAEISYRVFRDTTKNLLTESESETLKDDAPSPLRHIDSFPVSWAVSPSTPGGRGQFWSYLPSGADTTLRGIVNSTWKTSNDRQTLIDGPFNKTLMKAAAQLVAKSLPELSQREDIGAVFELLPARGREEQTALTTQFVYDVYNELAKVPCIPDQDGKPQMPTDIKIMPDPKDVSVEAASAWKWYRNRPVNWSHYSIQANATRYARVRGIKLVAAGFDLNASATDITAITPTVVEWLEALVADKLPESSIAAIEAARLCSIGNNGLDNVVKAKILLTDKGFRQLDAQQIFLPGRFDKGDLLVTMVHPKLSDDIATQATLSNHFNFKPLAANIVLANMLTQNMATFASKEWQTFWQLVNSFNEPTDPAKIILGHFSKGASTNDVRGQAGAEIKVFTLDGNLRLLNECLLPGRIIDPNTPENSGIAVDVGQHSARVISALGGVETPAKGRNPLTEPWFVKYRTEFTAEYNTHALGTPGEGQLKFSGPAAVGPLQPFFELTGDAKAKFVNYLLTIPEIFTPWQVEHRTQPNRWPRIDIPSPCLWLVTNYGMCDTSDGLQLLTNCIGNDLNGISKILPVAKMDNQIATYFDIPQTYAELSELQLDKILANLPLIDDEGTLAEIYAHTCKDRPAPTLIRCRVGNKLEDVRCSEVVAAFGQREFDLLKGLNKPTILAQSADIQGELIKKWGLIDPAEAIKSSISHAADYEAVPIIDEYSALSLVLDPQYRDIQLLRCSTLAREIQTDRGVVTTPIDNYFDGKTLYLSDRLTAEQVIGHINREFQLGLGNDEISDILENKLAKVIQERIQKIKGLNSDAEKLTELVGITNIENRLGQKLLVTAEEMEGELTPEKLGQLAIAAYGVGVLETFKSEIRANGFQAPDQWAGGTRTRNFVASFGFPREFAGFKKRNVDPTLDVAGPYELPPLHKYQEDIVKGAINLITNRTRAMLSLPTGSGKTRVAVQAITEWMKNQHNTDSSSITSDFGLFLWIAQSDELCEQAVRTFEEVWRSVGSQETLQISRLWASSEASEYTDGPQVVVATIDKLHSITKRSAEKKREYEWLEYPQCVCVDEAHRSMTPEYTAVLDWVNTNVRGRTSTENDSALLGLTATPYRGWSEQAAQALINRYGQTRLDRQVLGDDPYKTLQDQEFLAQVDQEVLIGGNIILTEEELTAMGGSPTPRWLPAAAEQRIAEDKDRNRALLDSIRNQPGDWTMLVFCASVDHSKTMAGLLNLKGIPAASISSETDVGARRHYIEEFRKGKLRVLTNHSVLSQGFDAPAVRAIYIARPVFSPNVYQQMVGRGLRGPKNGGKERCLLINVKDTFENFQGNLAFSEFEHLWRKGE